MPCLILMLSVYLCVLLSNVDLYGNFKMADKLTHFPRIATRVWYFTSNFPLTWCLASQNYDNVNVYSLFALSTNHVLCRIFNYRSERVIYFWPISVNVHWAFSAPIISRVTLAGLSWSVNYTIPVRKSSRSNNGESSWCSPGPLPRTTLESHHVFPACCRGKHICLLAVCSTFRLAYSLRVRPVLQDFDFFEPHSLCFSLFFGDSFFDRLSTAFVSDISQWSPACCMLRISTELLRELTVPKLRATAWIDCSHHAQLRPRVNAVFLLFYRTFTDRLAAASDAYVLPQSPTSSCIDDWICSRFVRITPVNFSMPVCFLCTWLLTLTDWYIFELKLMTLVSFSVNVVQAMGVKIANFLTKRSYWAQLFFRLYW